MENIEKNNSFNILDIESFFGVLKKRKKIVFLTTLICAFLTLFVSLFLISPKYSSSTNILVNKKNDVQQVNEQAQIQANVQMISTYKDIIKSPTILNSVSKKLENKGYKLTANEIKNEIDISTQPNSQVFTLTVKTKSPTLSADITNTVAKIFKDKVKKIMNVNNVSILSEAEPNTKPVSPKIMLNLLIGIMVGLLLGLIFAFVTDGLDKTVENEEFITDVLSLNDLGIISEIPASKMEELLSSSHFKHGRTAKRRV